MSKPKGTYPRRRPKRPYMPPRERTGETPNSLFFSMLSRMVQAAGKRVAHADTDDLAALVSIQADLDLAIRAGIAGLRDAGYSWKSIGEGLKPPVTGQAVYLRWGRTKAAAAEKAS